MLVSYLTLRITAPHECQPWLSGLWTHIDSHRSLVHPIPQRRLCIPQYTISTLKIVSSTTKTKATLALATENSLRRIHTYKMQPPCCASTVT